MKNKKNTEASAIPPLFSLSQGFICSLCLVSPWTVSLHLLFL